MAAKKQSRSEAAFIREARANNAGLTAKQARAAYKAVSDRLGRPALKRDIREHPRITKQEVSKQQKAAPPKREREREKEPPAAPPPSKPGRAWRDLAEYLDWFDGAEDYDYEEADGTVDY